VVSLSEALMSLAVAVAAGLLLGVERQQNARAQQKDEFGGIRTFPLVALLGALGALARPVAGPWLLAGSFLGVVTFVAVSHQRAASEGSIGVSSEVAALVAFALGAVSATHGLMTDATRHLLVGAAAALALALLAMKKPLHGFASRISEDDLYATVKFVSLALIVLPALPRGTYGPLDVLSPFKIGKMVVLIAGISFAGYIAARVVGAARGLLVAGLLGGLVSSTAVTLTYSGRARSEPALASLCAVAITAACSMMFARVLAVVGVVHRPLLAALAPSLGAMAVVGFGASWWFYQRSSRDGADGAGEGPGAALRNPFELRQALSFGLVYAAVLFIAKGAQTWFGSAGLYASAVLAGLTDVDAITLSVVEMNRAGLSDVSATTAIVLAAVTNTVVKAGIALWTGGPRVGRAVALTLGAALAAGAGVHIALRLR
jgi:uncharacterized membrane protein (DUF4010 family)